MTSSRHAAPGIQPGSVASSGTHCQRGPGLSSHSQGEQGQGSRLMSGPQHLLDLLEPEWERIWNRLKTTVVRGAAAGLSIRGGLHLMSTLLWLLRTSTSPKHARKQAQRALSSGEVLLDTARYTLFLAALGGSFVAVDEGLAILLGKDRTKAWRSLVAGAIAGHTVLLTGPRARHHSLATYVLLRGLTLLVRCGNKGAAGQPSSSQQQSLLARLLAPTRWSHGDVVLMCLASSQIVYSYIMMPGTLPPSYIRFLNKQAAKEQYVWDAVREQALNNWQRKSPGPLRQLQGTRWQRCQGHTPCEFWHPDQSCMRHAVGIVPHSYLRSLGVYLPVYLVPALLVHRQKLLSQPQVLLPKLLLGISRSALFLTSFIALAFAGACGGFNLTGTSTGPIIAASTAVGGLAILLEKKSRRMELALYCTSRALESFAWCLQGWGVVPDGLLPARTDVLLFSAGCAAIMHCYSDSCGEHRDVFRSKYLNVLDFVFGNTGVGEGAISHHPSNLDLVRTVTRSITSWSSGKLHGSVHSRSNSTPDLEHLQPREGAPASPSAQRTWSSAQLATTSRGPHQHSHFHAQHAAQHAQQLHLVSGPHGPSLAHPPANPRLLDPNHLQPPQPPGPTDWEPVSAPAFHSMRVSLISQACLKRGGNSTASLGAPDSAGSHSLSHFAQHAGSAGYSSAAQLARDCADETVAISPLPSGASSLSGGAAAAIAATAAVDAHSNAAAAAALTGFTAGAASAAAAAAAATGMQAVRQGLKRVSASGQTSFGSVRASGSGAAGGPAAAGAAPGVASSLQPRALSLRRIATAPCIQSLVQLASLDPDDGEEEGETNAEARVHGGSDRQEHMVHAGHFYHAANEVRLSLLSTAPSATAGNPPSEPVSIPATRTRSGRHHSTGNNAGSNASAGEHTQLGSPRSQLLSQSLSHLDGKQHGGSLLFGVRSLGRIAANAAPAQAPGGAKAVAVVGAATNSTSTAPAFTPTFLTARNGYNQTGDAALALTRAHRHGGSGAAAAAGSGVLSGGALGSGSGLPAPLASALDTQLASGLLVGHPAGSKLLAGISTAAGHSSHCGAQPLGSPFNGTPPDSPTAASEPGPANPFAISTLTVSQVQAPYPGVQAASSSHTAPAFQGGQHYSHSAPQLQVPPLPTAFNASSVSGMQPQQQGENVPGMRKAASATVAAATATTSTHVSGSGATSKTALMAAGAPAFTSTLLGWSSGRLQYVPTCAAAAPAPVNVVHATGETTVISSEHVLASAGAAVSAATMVSMAPSEEAAVQCDGTGFSGTLSDSDAVARASSNSSVGSASGALPQPQVPLSDVSFRSWSNFYPPSLAGHSSASAPCSLSLLQPILEVSGVVSGAESDAAGSTDHEGASAQRRGGQHGAGGTHEASRLSQSQPAGTQAAEGLGCGAGVWEQGEGSSTMVGALGMAGGATDEGVGSNKQQAAEGDAHGSMGPGAVTQPAARSGNSSGKGGGGGRGGAGGGAKHKGKKKGKGKGR